MEAAFYLGRVWTWSFQSQITQERPRSEYPVCAPKPLMAVSTESVIRILEGGFPEFSIWVSIFISLQNNMLPSFFEPTEAILKFKKKKVSYKRRLWDLFEFAHLLSILKYLKSHGLIGSICWPLASVWSPDLHSLTSWLIWERQCVLTNFFTNRAL